MSSARLSSSTWPSLKTTAETIAAVPSVAITLSIQTSDGIRESRVRANCKSPAQTANGKAT